MKILILSLLIGCSISVGWFIRAAIDDAIVGIDNGKKPLRWAAVGACNVAGLLWILSLVTRL